MSTLSMPLCQSLPCEMCSACDDFGCLPLSVAGFDHFCLEVQSDDINAVKQQLAAAGIEAEQQFGGVVVKTFWGAGQCKQHLHWRPRLERGFAEF